MSAENVYSQMVKGADIGWLEQMEASGYKFYDSTGVAMDCMDILKKRDINTIRLRVWVNPSNDRTNGHCSKKEVAYMAKRAKNKGLRVMIDFHYSDTWADPSHQTKPAAWINHTFNQLLSDVYNHTYEVLDTLKLIGAKPDWVQIGNEIPGGMLWPEGSTSNWSQLAQLLNKGYDAAKAIDSAIKVIVHLDQGNNNSRFRTFFDNAKNYNVKYDIIGMSYYPYWLGTDYTASVDNLGNNMNDMVTRYNKDVMVVEVGGDYTKVQNTYDMLVAVIKKVKSVANNRGLGVIYWEPEGEKSWSGYQLNCWNSDGRPTAALNAFLVNPPVNASVTFNVDMTGQDVSKGVFVTGTFNSWGFTALADPDNDKIFSTSLSLISGSDYVFYYIRNNSWTNYQTYRETLPSECSGLSLKYRGTTTPWAGDRYLDIKDAGTIVLNHKFSSCNGTSNVRECNKIQGLIIKPNPSNGLFSLQGLGLLLNTTIDITNMAGLKVKNIVKETVNDEYTLDLSELPKGTYLVRITSKNKSTTKPLILN